MRAQVRSFMADECGAELIEWAMVTAIIVLTTYVVMANLRDVVSAMFERLIRKQLH
jgi:Flp pilus assembly pilin Flp